MYLYRRQIKLVFTLLVLAGLVYGGIKGWMYYNASRAMDELSLAAAGHAEISYGAIDTELSGVVRVRDLRVLPSGAPQPIEIDSARLSGPDLPYFLWGQQGNQQQPPRLRLDLEGIRIDLDPALFDALQEEMAANGQTANDGCDPGAGIDPALLRELGLERLAMDAVMSYDYDADERRLSAEMELDVHQIERIQVSLALGDVAPDALSGGGNMNAIPTLAGLNLELRVEPAFGNRYLAACAKRRGQDVETLRKSLVTDTLAGLARGGLQLGPGLSEAVATYHRQWGDLRISAEPPAPLNLMALVFSPPENWQRQLGVRVALNQVAVNDLSFELRPPDRDELAVLMGEEPPPAKPTKPQDRYRYVYHDVPVATLVQHIGADVRLHLRDEQPMRAGTLMSVMASEARVEQRLHGGKMTAHVPLDEISRVEVRKVEKIPATK